MVEAMEQHRNDPSVIAGAAFALKNYTFEERNVRRLAQIPGVIELFNYAVSDVPDGNCQRDAAILLERFQDRRIEDEELERLAYDSLMDPAMHVGGVLGAMSEYEWSALIQRCGLQALAILAHAEGVNLNDDVMRKVVDTMDGFSNDNLVTMNGFALIEELCKNNEDYQKLVISAGVCKTVSNAMEQHMPETDVMIAASRVLRILSAHFECWWELEQIARGRAVDCVQELLRTHAEAIVIQEHGSEILNKFSSYRA